MIKLLTLTLFSILTTGHAYAGLNIYELDNKTIEMEVTGSKETTLGYGALTPKILIPELAAHSALNHRNFGEEAPCLAGLKMVVIDEPIKTMVKIKRELRMDLSESEGPGLCKTWMVETVEATVKGEKFSHVLQTPMPTRESVDCQL